MASFVICVSYVISETPACGFLKPSRQSALAMPRFTTGGGPDVACFLPPARLEITMMDPAGLGGERGQVDRGRIEVRAPDTYYVSRSPVSLPSHGHVSATDGGGAAYRGWIPVCDCVPSAWTRRFGARMDRCGQDAGTESGSAACALCAPDGAHSTCDRQHGHVDDVLV